MSSDEKIRELCARVIAADEASLPHAIEALQAAMREHLEGIRAMAVAALLTPVSPATDSPEV
jgi:hypothetical protein